MGHFGIRRKRGLAQRRTRRFRHRDFAPRPPAARALRLERLESRQVLSLGLGGVPQVLGTAAGAEYGAGFVTDIARHDQGQILAAFSGVLFSTGPPTARGWNASGILNPETILLTPEVTVTTLYNYASVQILPDGSTAAVYSFIPYNEAPAPGLFLRRFTADGHPLEGPTALISDRLVTTVDSILGADGNLWVTWFQTGFYLEPPSETGLFLRRFTQAGVPVGDRIRLSAIGESSSSAPDVLSRDFTGNVVVAWSENGVRARRFDVQGNPLDSEPIVVTDDAFDYAWLSLSHAADGRFAIGVSPTVDASFTGSTGSNEPREVRIVRFLPDGSSAGPDLILATPTQVNESRDRGLTFDLEPDGTFQAAWVRRIGTMQDESLFATRFPWSGPDGPLQLLNVRSGLPNGMPGSAIFSGQLIADDGRAIAPSWAICDNRAKSWSSVARGACHDRELFTDEVQDAPARRGAHGGAFLGLERSAAAESALPAGQRRDDRRLRGDLRGR